MPIWLSEGNSVFFLGGAGCGDDGRSGVDVLRRVQGKHIHCT